MKKFTLLMGAALLGLTASAADAIYVCGDNVNGSMNWTPGTPVEIVLTDGVYSFEAEGNFKMSTSKGSWDQFNANAFGTGSWTEVNSTTATADLAAWGSNTPAAKANEVVKYVVNADRTEITATYTATEVVHVVTLAGSFNGYNGNDSNYAFTKSEADANVYTYTWNGAFDKNFKVVADGTWYGTRDKIESGKTYTLGDTGNDNCTFAYATVNNPKFEYNINTKQLVVTYTVPGGEEEIVYSYKIHASWISAEEGWGRADMTEGENGIWSITQEVPANGEFGVKVVKNGEVDESSWVTALASDSQNCTGGNGSNIKITKAGTYIISYNPTDGAVTVKEDSSTGVATIEAANGEAVYFNMQGVRVANPENGLFIRVQNGKAVKVVK